MVDLKPEIPVFFCAFLCKFNLMKKNCEKGRLGESFAEEYLISKGFKIVAKNWRYSRQGEIDLIAIDKDSLVFIEVKARSSINFGYPIEAINYTKMNKIRILAGLYLNENKNLKFKKLRFDAVAVILEKEPQISHFKDIYQF